MGAAVDGERSITSVFHEVVGNLARIVRAEVRLAKVEAETTVAPWLAVLLVGAVAGSVAVLLLASGLKQLKGVSLLPPKALESPTGNGR